MRFEGGSTTIELRVGCGGRPTAWRATEDSRAVTLGSSNRVLNVTCNSPDARGYGNRNSCKFPPTGRFRPTQPGVGGYCTWLAAAMWRDATGGYLDVNGDAIAWDTSAAASGWRVSKVPHARSIIVFNTGLFGHAGWVTGVRRDGAGTVWVDFVDMNGGRLIDASRGITTDFDRTVNRSQPWSTAADWRFIVAPI